MKYHNTLKQAEKSAKESGNNYARTEWMCKCGQIRDAYIILDSEGKCADAHIVCRKCNPVKLGGKRKNCGRPKVNDKKEQTPIYIKRSRMELLGRKLVRKISSDAVEVEYQKRING